MRGPPSPLAAEGQTGRFARPQPCRVTGDGGLAAPASWGDRAVPPSGLEWHQLAGEVAEELAERRWLRRGPDDELADPGRDVLPDYLPGRCPASRHKGGGVAAGPALAYGGGQFGRNTAVRHG